MVFQHFNLWSHMTALENVIDAPIRVLGVARATVQARLGKLEQSGVVTGHGPDVDLAATGHAVQAFVTLEILDYPSNSPMAGVSESVQQAPSETLFLDTGCERVGRTSTGPCGHRLRNGRF